MILVTGSEGLIGRHICERLESAGHQVRRFDLRRSQREDTTHPIALAEAVAGVSGVIHLAAVSRVVWAERDPQACQRINVDALRNLIAACSAKSRPWLVFASSREVYGQADRLPVAEDSPMKPMNVYARGKVEGERLVEAAAADGLVTNICRFSNVYGCPDDHPDRVIPAFARTAAFGGTMSLEGADNTFDFTNVHDVCDGLFRLVTATIAGERLPPVHFVSGVETSLRRLAEIAKTRAMRPVRIEVTDPRSYDVAHFVGDPARAERLLGWKSTTPLEDGLSRLIEALRTSAAAATGTIPA